MLSIDTDTKLCGIIGNPVKHSLSPAIHNAAFDELGLNYVYLAFEVEDVAACLGGMRAMPNFRGLSVTIPHKLAVIDHLDEIEPLAQKVGSINTITNEGGRLIGSTTDGMGTIRAFDAAGIRLTGKRVLFLGAGGAVRAAAFAIADLCMPGSITVLGRSPGKVRRLAKDISENTEVQVESGDIQRDIVDALDSHDIIIQGTPIGMAPESDGETSVPAESLRPDHVVFDMVYKPQRTRLLREAETIGCSVVPGTEMLLHQAAIQFTTWTGKRAPLSRMRAELESSGPA